MKKLGMIRAVFMASAIYDGLLGGVFLFFSNRVFSYYGVEPPNHAGYVQFPALLLIVFAVMFCVIASDPVRNRNLMPYGVMLKVAYCGVILFHWLGGSIPNMWKPFCVADLVFMVLFVGAWRIAQHAAQAE